MAERTLIMGTRGSALALAQSRQVASALQAAHPGLEVVERIIRTTGDRQQGSSLPSIGGKGVFTLEIEEALQCGEIDFAVHSLKDLPPALPAGLCLAAVPERANPVDVLVFKRGYKFDPTRGMANLPENARVGTSSLRRRAQLLHGRPDLRIEDLRGNIDTRLRKLDTEGFDAIVLAAAGLNRLEGQLDEFDLERRMCELHPVDFIPAPGQGALAIEAGSNPTVLQLLSALEHPCSRTEITVERAVMDSLSAGCSTPLGVFAALNEDMIWAWSAVFSPDGRERIRANTLGDAADPQKAGAFLAQRLIEQGARRIIEECEKAAS